MDEGFLADHPHAADPHTWSLRLDGWVTAPRSFRLAELRRMPQSELSGPLRCSAGAWTVPQNTWIGVAVADLLALVSPLPQARLAVARGQEYTAVVRLSELRASLVALVRNGRPLDAAQGAPARLVLPSGDGARSVKWLDRITLTA